MRPLASAIVFLGAFVLGVDIGADRVVVDLPLRGNHGVHVSDVLGTALLVVGVALLWRRSSRTTAAETDS